MCRAGKILSMSVHGKSSREAARRAAATDPRHKQGGQQQSKAGSNAFVATPVMG